MLSSLDKGASQGVYVAFRSQVFSLVSLDLEMFLSFLILHSLNILKSTGLLLCKMLFILGLSDVSASLSLGYAFGAGISKCRVSSV